MKKVFFWLQVSEENLCGGFYLSFAFAKIKRSVDFKFAFSCSSFKKMRRKFNDELNLSMAWNISSSYVLSTLFLPLSNTILFF